MPTYSIDQAVELVTLIYLIGREGRGTIGVPPKLGIAWSVRNRVERPGWWGHGWMGVMTKYEQYTSMNPPLNRDDPNLRVYPDLSSNAWRECIEAAEAAYNGTETDPVQGATHYFDQSLDADPPFWAAKMTHVCDIDSLRFYR